MEMIRIIEKINTTGFTLVIPSISVGNIGQLAVDLMITSQNFKKFATLWDPAIVPVVGGDPFASDSNDISIACELYVNEALKVLVMQMRSSIEFKLAINFFTKLKKLIMELDIKEVVILTSMFAHELHNINSPRFRYISNDDNVEPYKKMNVLPMEVNHNGRYILYGGGFAAKLYEMLSDCLKCTVLIQYCFEGDNRSDAVLMLNTLYNLKGIVISEIVFPHSWKYVFGNPPPFGIY